jgi:hypothetical protein
MTCKEAAELEAHERLAAPSRAQWLSLRLHWAICAACRHYRNQLGWIDRACRQFTHDHDAAGESGPTVPDPAAAAEGQPPGPAEPVHPPSAGAGPGQVEEPLSAAARARITAALDAERSADHP